MIPLKKVHGSSKDLQSWSFDEYNVGKTWEWKLFFFMSKSWGITPCLANKNKYRIKSCINLLWRGIVILCMIGFIILIFHSAITRPGKITFAVFSDIYAGINYLILWFCGLNVMRSKELKKHIIGLKYSASFRTTIIGVVLLVYTVGMFLICE